MGVIVGSAGSKATTLATTVKEGDAYGALQTYKTFHARWAKKGKFAESVDLVRSGAIELLTHGHLTAGGELALILVETLETGEIEQDEGGEVLGILCEVNDAFDKIEGTNKAEIGKIQYRFLKASIGWSTLKKFGKYEKGDPKLHHLAAKAKLKVNDVAGACNHYLHAQQPTELAGILFQWSSMGYQNERDLFLARTVLQLLALQDIKNANAVHDTFIALLKMKNQPMKETPLSNFIQFLLKTVERDAYPLFKMLCEKYERSISRDPSFQSYLDRISDVIFGVKPQKKGLQAMMENMMGMFGGGR